MLLNPAEKEISRVVTLAFGQKVCGFDLLRSEKGRSYVCDVNGWSFVKSSRKYYDDAAGECCLLSAQRHAMGICWPASPWRSPWRLVLPVGCFLQEQSQVEFNGCAG